MFDREKLTAIASVGAKAAFAATAIFFGGAIEGLATLKYTPNNAPLEAIKLPDNRSNLTNYLVPASEAGQVKCGRPITWLPGGIFHLEMTRSETSITEFETGGFENTKDKALLANYTNAHDDIVTCVASFDF